MVHQGEGQQEVARHHSLFIINILCVCVRLRVCVCACFYPNYANPLKYDYAKWQQLEKWKLGGAWHPPATFYYYRLAGVSARGKVETFCIIWLPLAANFAASLSRSPCHSRLIKYAKLFGILNNFRDGATFSIKAPKRAQSKQGARPSRTAVPNGIAVERVIKLAAKRISAAERKSRNEREKASKTDRGCERGYLERERGYLAGNNNSQKWK